MARVVSGACETRRISGLQHHRGSHGKYWTAGVEGARSGRGNTRERNVLCPLPCIHNPVTKDVLENVKINFFKEDPVPQIARFDQCKQNVVGIDTTIVELERFLHFH